MSEKNNNDKLTLSQRIAKAYQLIVGNDKSIRIENNVQTKEQAQEFFGPSEPQAPAAQHAAFGRRTDYRTGFNLDNRKFEGYDFADLRAFADNYDLLRLVIEERKNQVCKMPYYFKVKEDCEASEEHKEKIKELKKFFEMPDKENSFDTWIRMILEDMLVIDAATILPRKTRGGDIYSLEVIDGATVKRVIDGTGRTPLPPETAYQQVIKGIAAVDYTTEELFYCPRNKRSNKFYGFSPVEQILMTVNIALRRQTYQLQYYTEGNMPEALVGVPSEWTAEQIAEFQMYFDEVNSDQSQRRKMKFIPGGMSLMNTKESAMKDNYDEWLARVICFAFNISPQSLIASMNRATAETAMKQALEEGLTPVLLWIENLINRILRVAFEIDDIDFCFDIEQEQDPLIQAQINEIYLRNKVIDINEVRESLGYEKKEITEEPTFNDASNPFANITAQDFMLNKSFSGVEIKMPELIIDVNNNFKDSKYESTDVQVKCNGQIVKGDL